MKHICPIPFCEDHGITIKPITGEEAVQELEKEEDYAERIEDQQYRWGETIEEKNEDIII